MSPLGRPSRSGAAGAPWWVSALSATALSATAWSAAAPPPDGAVAGHPSPEETRAELTAVCTAWTEGDDPYFGTAPLTPLRQRLSDPGLSPRERVEAQFLLGRKLLHLDHTQAAISSYQAALAGALEHRAPRRVRQKLRHDLALAHLLVAEDENCVARHAPASCILPIAPEAVHLLTEHTRRAVELYEDYLEESPGDLQVRWLYNLARDLAGDDPQSLPERWRAPAFESDTPFPRWHNVAPRLGVDRLDLAGGAVIDDFDGDGLLDLVSSTWDPCDHLKGFRNDGRGGFEDVSEAWGLDAQLGGLNLVHADFDNDGRLDLLVLRGAWLADHGEVRNSLLRNDLGGETNRFVDVTAAAGLTGAYPTQTAAWADFDSDGDLDLYIGNEADAERAYPCELYRNDGAGAGGSVHFTEIAAAAGVRNLRFAKGVAWGDVDDDGDPDLYVSNLGGANRLYRNLGNGADGRVTFTDIAEAAGVTEPRASFPTWFFDFDNDGDLDLLVAAYSAPYPSVSASYLGVAVSSGHPLLYRNDGVGDSVRFTEVSRQLGLTRPLLPMGSNYGDLDNDGYLDLYFGTGTPDLAAVMPNAAYRNDAGHRFLDVTAAGGFGHLQKGHGVAFGDLDNDGDQDLFQQMGGAYPVDAYFNALYENPLRGDQPEAGWITLRLEGRRANRFGVGARIEVRLRRDGALGPPGAVERRSVHLLAGAGGSFGGSSMQQEIGLGDAQAIEAVVVRWPGSGTVQTFEDVEMRRIYRLIEGERELVAVELPVLELGRETEAPAAHHPRRGTDETIGSPALGDGDGDSGAPAARSGG